MPSQHESPVCLMENPVLTLAQKIQHLESASMSQRRHFGARFAYNFSAWSTAIGCGASMLVALERGFEGGFYPLSTIMHTPWRANAAFGYRLLLPSVAVKLQQLFPRLTDHNCFIATQVLAIAAAIYLSGEWARIFLPRFGRHFGYAAVTLMICPTIDYWNFYDIGIVAIWTGCLLLLYRGHLT